VAVTGSVFYNTPILERRTSDTWVHRVLKYLLPAYICGQHTGWHEVAKKVMHVILKDDHDSHNLSESLRNILATEICFDFDFPNGRF
jgi:hypothetical protein